MRLLHIRCRSRPHWSINTSNDDAKQANSKPFIKTCRTTKSRPMLNCLADFRCYRPEEPRRFSESFTPLPASRFEISSLFTFLSRFSLSGADGVPDNPNRRIISCHFASRSVGIIPIAIRLLKARSACNITTISPNDWFRCFRLEYCAFPVSISDEDCNPFV